MTTTKAKTEEKLWAESVGPRGNRIRVFEEVRGGNIYYETADPALRCGVRCRSLKHMMFNAEALGTTRLVSHSRAHPIEERWVKTLRQIRLAKVRDWKGISTRV